MSDGGAALMDASQTKKALEIEPLVEGVVEDVVDSDSEEVKQVQPQNEK